MAQYKRVTGVKKPGTYRDFSTLFIRMHATPSPPRNMSLGIMVQAVARFISPVPRCSMYGIFSYIYHKFKPNVGKHTIHGWYGYNKPTQQKADIKPRKACNAYFVQGGCHPENQDFDHPKMLASKFGISCSRGPPIFRCKLLVFEGVQGGPPIQL